VKAEMSNPEFSGPGPEETSLPDWYQFFLEAKERLQTHDSTILELTQKFEDMETRMRQVQYESFQFSDQCCKCGTTRRTSRKLQTSASNAV
jgi:hypothetical protein